eukprot:11442314-Ditylum_brightwellii.AAC.1
MEEMQSKEVDIWGWAETNVKWTKEMENKAKYMGGKIFKQFTIVTSCSDDPATYHQQGGTCTGVTNQMSGQIIEKNCDPSGLGRWSYFKIASRDQRQ